MFLYLISFLVGVLIVIILGTIAIRREKEYFESFQNAGDTNSPQTDTSTAGSVGKEDLQSLPELQKLWIYLTVFDKSSIGNATKTKQWKSAVGGIVFNFTDKPDVVPYKGILMKNLRLDGPESRMLAPAHSGDTIGEFSLIWFARNISIDSFAGPEKPGDPSRIRIFSSFANTDNNNGISISYIPKDKTHITIEAMLGTQIYEWDISKAAMTFIAGDMLYGLVRTKDGKVYLHIGNYGTRIAPTRQSMDTNITQNILPMQPIYLSNRPCSINPDKIWDGSLYMFALYHIALDVSDMRLIAEHMMDNLSMTAAKLEQAKDKYALEQKDLQNKVAELKKLIDEKDSDIKKLESGGSLGKNLPKDPSFLHINIPGASSKNQ